MWLQRCRSAAGGSRWWVPPYPTKDEEEWSISRLYAAVAVSARFTPKSERIVEDEEDQNSSQKKRKKPISSREPENEAAGSRRQQSNWTDPIIRSQEDATDCNRMKAKTAAEKGEWKNESIECRGEETPNTRNRIGEQACSSTEAVKNHPTNKIINDHTMRDSGRETKSEYLYSRHC
jgi:hypothetical protein